MKTSRLRKSLNALSQFGNVTLLRRHHDTNANESISGRCHWEAQYGKEAGHWTWVWAERFIDIIFFWDREEDMGHCESSDKEEYDDAKEKVRRYEARQQRKVKRA